MPGIIRAMNDVARAASGGQRYQGPPAAGPAAPTGDPPQSFLVPLEHEPSAEDIAAARSTPPPLDEGAGMLARYLVMTPAQIDCMTLIAVATWLKAHFVAFPRVLFTSQYPESGKTEAMRVLVALCSNPFNTKGTSYALQSRLATAANEPGTAPLTLYRDEISDIFGQSGLNGAQNPIAGVLREGYKAGATMTWSVSRQAVDFDISGIFLMAGLRTAVPTDIRTRCIVFQMVPGTPADYFDIRSAEPSAKRLGKALAAWGKAHKEEIEAFRARGLHPKLRGRRLEIWEPLFAVAAAAGQGWLNRCMTAFLEIALDESDQPVLTPMQETVRDVWLAATSGRVRLFREGTFVSGMDLVDAVKRTGSDLYAGSSDLGIARIIGEAMLVTTGVRSVQRRCPDHPEGRLRGYLVRDIEQAWETIRPPDPDDVEVPPEFNLFAVDDSDDSDDVSVDEDRSIRETAVQAMFVSDDSGVTEVLRDSAE